MWSADDGGAMRGHVPFGKSYIQRAHSLTLFIHETSEEAYGSGKIMKNFSPVLTKVEKTRVQARRKWRFMMLNNVENWMNLRPASFDYHSSCLKICKFTCTAAKCGYCIKCIIIILVFIISYCSPPRLFWEEVEHRHRPTTSTLIFTIPFLFRWLKDKVIIIVRTFDVHYVLPNLSCDLNVGNELDEIINCVNRWMNRLEPLDLLTNRVRIVDDRLKLRSWSWIIVVYCHIYSVVLLLRLSNFWLGCVNEKLFRFGESFTPRLHSISKEALIA